jgi:hypothetical protein
VHHQWKFARVGGVDQVVLRDGADIVNLDQLDQKLWVALAMPTRGLEFDPRTLDVLDTDKDGRVRAPEIVAAVRWAKESFKNPTDLLEGGDSVPLSAICEGPVLVGAKRLLENLGKKDADCVTLADVANTEKIFAATQFNGDGVIPADAAAEEGTCRAIEDVISILGSITDRSGQPGIDQKKADAFFAEAQLLADWSARGEADRAMLVLGEGTAAAATAFRAVRSKIDDYFTRCRLAEFDARAAAPLNRAEADYAALAPRELSASDQEVTRLPLAHVDAAAGLPLSSGLNPAWSAAMRGFATKVVEPLFTPGKRSLSEAEWTTVKEKLAAYCAWLDSKPTTAVEKLGIPRVRDLVRGGFKENIAELIKKDLALEGENAQIALVEKLVLFQRDLFRLLNNFVCFSEFYSRKGAIFQSGTLYLDGRSCDLCVTVTDAAKHSALTGLAATHLAYCDCTRPNGENLSIVAAFTDGDSDNLIVGRNGVFYDRKKRDWDATITRIVSNPISIREAFWSPYKKLARLVEEQVAKRASSAEADAHAKLGDVATTTANADKAKKEEPKKIDVGTVAAIGVAVGGIGAMVAGLLSSFFGLGVWMPVGVLAAILLVSGPSMLLAYLKLRQRNLGPILDASGWAINGRARINVPFGAALTHVATLPPGSRRSLDDPYAEKKRPWKTYAVIAAILALAALWYIGKLDEYIPARARSVSLLGENAPAFHAESAPAPAKATK